MNNRQYYYDNVYNTTRWKKLREYYILSDPTHSLCACCIKGHAICCAGLSKEEAEKIEGYNKTVYNDMYIVDHIISLDVDYSLAFDIDNLQSLCLSCHSRKTKRIDTKMKRDKRIDATHEDLENFN